ncbi:Holliday junction branch migration protein RuvA [Candidatus Peregrinibacteria bacterium CG_4_9_14_0_2_um_filter_53_11]|nr:MAG: Holliday junction branch migration protein RuvA [Candidatus Peregrinibacteria bacterium CG_4_9_14_0_2_um_filter_53_11]
MIAYLDGTIIDKHERTLIIGVGGVGYLVHVSRAIHDLHNKGQAVELFIHTNVREDDLSLYGFPEMRQLEFFKLLIGVSGVGPRSALEIMNTPLERLRSAIARKEILVLTKIQGIGKKTAERICVDLENKMSQEELTARAEEAEPDELRVGEDIIQALISLGYKRHHVMHGLKDIPETISKEEDVIKYFLQHA